MTATLDVMQAFPTVIGRWMVPDADLMNEDLQALILARKPVREPWSQQHRRLALADRLPQPSRFGGRRIDQLDHMGDEQDGCRHRRSRFTPGHGVAVGMGDDLPQRFVSCAAFSSGQRVVRCVLRRRRHDHGGSFAQWRTGVHRSTCRRGSRDRAGRSVRGTHQGPAASRAHRDLSELALSLGPSLCGAHATHRGFVQRRAKRRLTETLPALRLTCRYPSHTSSSQSDWR